MENFLDFLRQFGERFNELSQGKKVAALSLVALALASLLVMSLWLKTPDYQLLYANLSSEDAGAIVDKLKSQKIPFELSNQGRTIRVASDRLYEVRLQLASEGLPEGSDVGLEIFDDTPLGMTEFVQKLNFQRALQGELTRTIKTLDAVAQVRIHLVIPKDNLFRKDKPKGKASVTLKIKSGKTLTETQVQGIVHLVSASVGGIDSYLQFIIRSLQLFRDLVKGLHFFNEGLNIFAVFFASTSHGRNHEAGWMRDMILL